MDSVKKMVWCTLSKFTSHRVCVCCFLAHSSLLPYEVWVVLHAAVCVCVLYASYTMCYVPLKASHTVNKTINNMYLF